MSMLSAEPHARRRTEGGFLGHLSNEICPANAIVVFLRSQRSNLY